MDETISLAEYRHEKIMLEFLEDQLGYHAEEVD